MDTSGNNLRVCDHLLHEYESDFLGSAPFQRDRHNERALLEFCEKYGYSARDVYAYADAVDIYEGNVQDYCHNFSYDRAASIISDVQVLHFPDDLRHHVINIIPTDVGRNFTFDFVSEYVYKCVLESLRKSEANAASKLYRLFLTNRQTAPAGFMLEPAAHNLLANGGSFDIIMLKGSRIRTNIHWRTPETLSDEVQTRLHITSSSISVGERIESPLGEPPIFSFGKETALERFGLYCPTSKIQATFDYLVYEPEDKHAWIFQVTVSPSHSVKEKGIENLLERNVKKITYIAITSDTPATIDLPFSPALDRMVTSKYQLVLR